MTPGNIKISVLLAITIAGCFTKMTAQVTSAGCERKGYTAIRFYKNDIVKVSCDTIFMINSETYKLYEELFMNHRSLNRDVQKLTSLYDHAKMLYENRIADQDLEYTQLRNQFNKLTLSSQELLKSNAVQLGKLDNSLSEIDRNILASQMSMNEARELFQKEINRSKRNKFRWGAQGFLIGIAFSAIIALLAN
jgi:hypothetical protein